MNRLSGREYVVESHQTHRELTNGPCDPLGFPKLGSSWDQVQDRCLGAPPSVLTVCETDPAVCKKSAFQFCEFIKVQGHGEIDVSRVPRLRWEMYLVRNGPDDYKFCSECPTMFLQDSEGSAIWLSVSSGIAQARNSRLSSSAASCALGSEEYISSA